MAPRNAKLARAIGLSVILLAVLAYVVSVSVTDSYIEDLETAGLRSEVRRVISRAKRDPAEVLVIAFVGRANANEPPGGRATINGLIVSAEECEAIVRHVASTRPDHPTTVTAAGEVPAVEVYAAILKLWSFGLLPDAIKSEMKLHEADLPRVLHTDGEKYDLPISVGPAEQWLAPEIPFLVDGWAAGVSISRKLNSVAETQPVLADAVRRYPLQKVVVSIRRDTTYADAALMVRAAWDAGVRKDMVGWAFGRGASAKGFMGPEHRVDLLTVRVDTPTVGYRDSLYWLTTLAPEDMSEMLQRFRSAVVSNTDVAVRISAVATARTDEITAAVYAARSVGIAEKNITVDGRPAAPPTAKAFVWPASRRTLRVIMTRYADGSPAYGIAITSYCWDSLPDALDVPGTMEIWMPLQQLKRYVAAAMAVNPDRFVVVTPSNYAGITSADMLPAAQACRDAGVPLDRLIVWEK